MLGSAPRRFYKIRRRRPKASAAWQVTLDGKVLRSPAKNDLNLPTPKPWPRPSPRNGMRRANKIRPHSMPLMQFAATAIDRVGPEQTRIVADLAGYAGDRPHLLPRRRTADPGRTRDPGLGSAAGLGAAALRRLAHRDQRHRCRSPQPPATLEALSRAVDGYDDFSSPPWRRWFMPRGSLVIGACRGGRGTDRRTGRPMPPKSMSSIRPNAGARTSEAVDRRIGQLAEMVAARRFSISLA